MVTAAMRRHGQVFTLTALWLLAMVHVAAGAGVAGRVIGVTDGDTLTLLDAGHRQTKIRLAEIDTPESRQPYGTRAKQALSGLVFGRDVRVFIVDTDRYGRTVARVCAGSIDVSSA